MKNHERTNRIPDSVSTDTLYELLSDFRRRVVLSLLVTHGRQLTVNDLTKELVVREEELPITKIPGKKLTRIAISLHHCHLPKLADAGFVTYDANRQIVAPTDKLEQLKAFLSSTLGERNIAVMTPESQNSSSPDTH